MYSFFLKGKYFIFKIHPIEWYGSVYDLNCCFYIHCTFYNHNLSSTLNSRLLFHIIMGLPVPGTLAIQRRCDEQTWKDSRTSAGLFASITVTLLKYVIALKYWQLGNIYKSSLSSKKDGINLIFKHKRTVGINLSDPISLKIKNSLF